MTQGQHQVLLFESLIKTSTSKTPVWVCTPMLIGNNQFSKHQAWCYENQPSSPGNTFPHNSPLPVCPHEHPCFPGDWWRGMAWSHAASWWLVSWHLDSFIFGNRKAKVKTPPQLAAFSGWTKDWPWAVSFWERDICMKWFPLKTLQRYFLVSFLPPAEEVLWIVTIATGRGWVDKS